MQFCRDDPTCRGCSISFGQRRLLQEKERASTALAGMHDGLEPAWAEELDLQLESSAAR